MGRGRTNIPAGARTAKLEEFPPCLGGGPMEPCPVIEAIIRGEHPRPRPEIIEAGEREEERQVDEAVDALLAGKTLPQRYHYEQRIARKAAALIFIAERRAS